MLGSYHFGGYRQPALQACSSSSLLLHNLSCAPMPHWSLSPALQLRLSHTSFLTPCHHLTPQSSFSVTLSYCCALITFPAALYITAVHPEILSTEEGRKLVQVMIDSHECMG